MKKVFLLLFIVFFVCGCSNLKCERVIDNEDKTIKVTFKDEKVNKLSIHEIKSFSRTDAYLDLYYYEQNTYLSSLNIPDGFNFSVVDHKEDVTTKISIDFSKVKEDVSSVTSIKRGMSKEEVLNTLNNQGYVCK